MAKYALKNAALQDAQTKSVVIVELAGNLGSVDTGVLTIAKSNLDSDDLEILRSSNLDDNSPLVIAADMDGNITIGDALNPVVEGTPIVIHIKLK